MKVVIVNCFDTYEDRVELLHEFFKKKNYEVTVIQSNFRHFKKTNREKGKKDFVFIKSTPYYKNLSVKRLVSHYKYAKDAFNVVETIKPNLLYVLAPPNSLIKFANKYKQKNIDVKLIFDLIDLWPETMPIGKLKNFFAFKLWSDLRDNNLSYANFVITECNLYKDVLEDVLKNIKTETLYLAKKENKIISNPKLSKDEIHLAYLGSINNIIDIPKIKEIVQSLKTIKPVTLHIIGDGEKKQELLNEIKKTGIVIKYYGKIYDLNEKQKIFDLCHFGLNIMKENVCVGLTMKSVDYFQHSLPIINNIPSDTTEIVNRYKIGYNLNGKITNDILSKICNQKIEENIKMREETHEVFLNLFSVNAFNSKLCQIMDKIK